MQLPTPRATYRLQLRGGVDLDDAAALVPYLARLGVSHLYCSPYLTAAPGSTHGYDGVDPTRVDPELGGEAARDRLVAALDEHGMSHVLDIVPNHLAASMPANQWLDDVARRGSRSRYARFFDIDWASAERRLGRPVVMIPSLGDQLGRLIEDGEVRLHRIDGDVYASVHGLSWPLRPESQVELVDVDLEAVAADPDELAALLDEQHVRPVWWRMGESELDYRRFFDVDSLMAVRVEDPEVYDETHATVIGWLAEGSLAGVRIDHVDGLADPAGYLARLREEAPDSWLLVEKILEGNEQLRDWAIDGDTGYQVASDLAALFVDPSGQAPLDDLAAELTGDEVSWSSTARLARREAATEVLGADLGALVERLAVVRDRHRRFGDLSRHRLRDALVELVVAFDTYRTYLVAGSPAGDEDRVLIETAAEHARVARPDLADGALALLVATLLGDAPFDTEVEDAVRVRFQQFSGPVAAKGVEDTAMYRHVSLLGLNDVGSDPGHFGHEGIAGFHTRRQADQERWPSRMITLSTHDTKRSADVRARLLVLSELAAEWSATVRRWHVRNARHRSATGPDGRDELVTYQTLLGAHPLGVDRAVRYAEKASREAKVRTSWVDPDPAYDAALGDFVRALHDDEGFLAELDAWVERVQVSGQVNSLAMQLLSMTLPGVPDLYQGCELWDLSLVDPDNRRPVDFELRARLLGEVERFGGVAPWWPDPGDGRAKLGLVHRVLAVRAEHPAAFGAGASGRYRPIDASGQRAHHVVAFGRGDDVVVIVPRLVHGLAMAGGWADTSVELPHGRWRDGLTHASVDGTTVRLAELLDTFPVAMLVREST